MSQLGFTFYPKDWWTSDSFFALNPFERYIYLELLFMMYVNDGLIANDRVNVERRLGVTIKDDVWVRITERFVIDDSGCLTHVSVNKRLRKTLANRENGLKGGRPDLEMELTALDGKVIPREPNAGDHFIYLFRNLSNNTYKIGETKDLFKRRLTIKIPTADLKIIHFEFIDRSKNLEIERHLKLRFIDKQISGDWFSLTNGDVNELITEMQSLKKPNNPLNNRLKNPPSEKNRNRIEIESEGEKKIDPAPPIFHPGSISDLDTLAKEALADRVYFVEHVFRQFRIPPESLAGHLKAFNEHLRSIGETQKTKKDYRGHFQNWIKIQQKTKQQSQSRKMREI